MRRVRTVVAAKPKMGGLLQRVIGSTDFLGQGTEFEIAEVGPFILLEDVHGLEGPDQPPFGMHPHAGLVAVSWVPAGEPWYSHSNAPHVEGMGIQPQQVLVSVAGRGIVHDETSVGGGTHELLQIILRMPSSHAGAPPSMAASEAVVVAPGVMRAFDATTLEGTGIDAAGYHIDVDAGVTVELDIAQSHTTGFVFARNGSVEIDGTLIPPHHVGVLTSHGDTLRLRSAGNSPAEVFVGLGVPLDEPWVKLLGHEGFLVAIDEASARAKMAEFERDPNRFGHL